MDILYLVVVDSCVVITFKIGPKIQSSSFDHEFLEEAFDISEGHF